jgi:hypothetical protein
MVSADTAHTILRQVAGGSVPTVPLSGSVVTSPAPAARRAWPAAR